MKHVISNQNDLKLHDVGELLQFLRQALPLETCSEALPLVEMAHPSLCAPSLMATVIILSMRLSVSYHMLQLYYFFRIHRALPED